MNYESAHGKFLPGIGKNGCCWGTWMIPILPYMEQENLFKFYVNFGGLDTTGPRYNGGANANVARTRLKTFTCPSDQEQLWGSWTKHNYALNAGNTTLYQSNLPFNCTNGSTTGANGCVTFGGAPFGWYENSNQVNDSTVPWSGAGAPPIENGRMGRQRTIAEITDGTSNTICVSEVLQGRSNDLRGFSWWGGGAGFTTHDGPNTTLPDVITGGICVNQTNPRMPCTTTSTTSRARMMAARSLHTNGVNVALCDGSVRFVTNAVSITTWRALGSASGGDILGNDF
jgi:prepilin-type processing-associated H-X9-DG protein